MLNIREGPGEFISICPAYKLVIRWKCQRKSQHVRDQTSYMTPFSGWFCYESLDPSGDFDSLDKNIFFKSHRVKKKTSNFDRNHAVKDFVRSFVLFLRFVKAGVHRHKSLQPTPFICNHFLFFRPKISALSINRPPYFRENKSRKS